MKEKIFEYLEVIAPLVPFPLYWLDCNGTFLGGNELCLHVTGAKTLQYFIGKTYDKIHSHTIAQELVANIQSVIKLKKTIETEEVIKDFTTGKNRYFLSIRSPLFEDSEIVGIIATSIEITEKKETEQKLSESQEQFRKISAQVAHDIGSPLAALQMVIPHCDSLPENTRNVLSKSATRIADIAENFLNQFKPQDEFNTQETKRVSTLISAELLEIITEKKYEYSKLPIDILLNISQSGYFSFINIDTKAFKRMLSNLINNAVDALDENIGKIILDVSIVNDDKIQIIVEDNGKGMPQSVKDKILNNIAITEGKTSGHGIGFTQIRETLRNNDGKFDIESKECIGTKIILTFPKIDTPDWIAESIEISNNDLVVILDDDEAIHGAWETRFEKSAPNIKRKHFKQGDEAIVYINSLSAEDKQRVFLLTDYELLRQGLHGLDVIEQSGIKRSILVTSHHNNLLIRDKAKQTNTKILPKPLASVIEIRIFNDLLHKININPQENVISIPKIKPKIFEQLEFLASIIPTPFYWADTECVVAGINKLGINMVNNIFIDNNVIGKTAYDIYIPSSAKMIEDHSRQVMAAKKPMVFNEEVVDLASGLPNKYISIRAPLFEDGKVVGIVGTITEVARHESMISNKSHTTIFEELDKIANLIPIPIFWLDTNGVVLGANNITFKKHGISNIPEKVIGKDHNSFYPNDVAEIINENNNKVVQLGQTIEFEEKVISIATGATQHYTSIRSPLYNEIGEVIGIVGTSLEITDRIEKERLEKENQAHIAHALEQQLEFRKISAQVAHDIGSPLAALQMVIPHCDSLPENTRNVLSKSATRIADIAENFLSQFKPQDELNIQENKRIPTLISAEILELLTEKKYEYSKLPVDIISNISNAGAFAFIDIDTRAFKRMLSNLINNAVDALDGQLGEVTLSLDTTDNQVQIIVTDNGKGMPESVKNKILNNIAITEDKTNGHGIGFTQIREALNNNDGTLSIESQQNLGTKIILTFPKIATPDWMAESIELGTNDLVVILDDDEAIHGAWETRFEKSAPNVKRKHFKQGNEAVVYINSLSSEDKQRIFLLTDYELLRQGLHGLDVIEQTGIKRSILVTSHHNNLIIRDKAEQTNTKILPKPLASIVPINNFAENINLTYRNNYSVKAKNVSRNIPQIFKDLERLAPFIPSPLYWLDTNIYVIGANKACLDAIGSIGSLDVMVGKTFSDFLPKELAEELISTTKLVLETRSSIKVDEWGIVASGEKKYFETIKTPLFDDNNIIIGVLCTAVDVTAEKEREHLKIEIQKSEQEAFRKISAQVAHDIGSPLAALQMVIPHCDSLPENTRNVLSKSATRIADIAENFLSQFKPQDELSTQEIKRIPTLISAEILELLTEKKYEYSKFPVDITSNISNSGAFAFIDVDTRSFKRMLSNLINNAIDALEENIGEITLSLDSKDNQVQIIVTDNGKGMPESVKDKILNNIAITEGKTCGHGIGFTQIRETLNNNDGTLSIESQQNLGTKIILTFPKIATPDWMAESIELGTNDLVVILDDDEAIHGAWETRFEKSAPNIKRKHFKQGDEAVVYINSLSSEDKQRVFLLTDYELLRQGLHGLDVIAQTGIKSSILVTSHHNNLIIRDKAKQTNTKILPKPLASEVQININQSSNMTNYTEQREVDLVILDDDIELVDMILMYVVQESNQVDKYHKPQDLLNSLAQYPKTTQFLIDNQYKGENITGLEIVKQLYESGFSNLYLFTNEVFEDRSVIPEYVQIIAKDDLKSVTELLIN